MVKLIKRDDNQLYQISATCQSNDLQIVLSLPTLEVKCYAHDIYVCLTYVHDQPTAVANKCHIKRTQATSGFQLSALLLRHSMKNPRLSCLLFTQKQWAFLKLIQHINIIRFYCSVVYNCPHIIIIRGSNFIAFIACILRPEFWGVCLQNIAAVYCSNIDFLQLLIEAIHRNSHGEHHGQFASQLLIMTLGFITRMIKNEVIREEYLEQKQAKPNGMY